MNWPIKSSHIKTGYNDWHMTQSGQHVRIYRSLNGVIQEEVRLQKSVLKYLTENYK